MTADPNAPLDPSALASNPVLANLFQQNPDLLAQLTGSGAPAQTFSLADALIGSAMTVSGRQGLTGGGFTGTLPPWAANLAPEILNSPDFDPYLGIVSQSGDERVYMGSQQYKVTTHDTPTSKGLSSGDGIDFRSGGGAVTESGSVPGDTTLTAVQAQNLPYTWDEQQVADAMKKMRKAGIPVDSFDTGTNSLVSVWGSMVDRAAMTYAMSQGERKVTPWDVLDLYKSEAKASGTYLDPNRSTTTTQRTVSDITEGEAWTTLQSQLSQMLGRDPSDQETRDFTYRMNQLAAQNPSISKTITQYKNGQASSSNTHTSGGFTGADVAQAGYEQAQNNPDYAEYQSATTYLNAALSALGPIGG